jgi:hypothetical protein
MMVAAIVRRRRFAANATPGKSGDCGRRPRGFAPAGLGAALRASGVGSGNGAVKPDVPRRGHGVGGGAQASTRRGGAGNRGLSGRRDKTIRRGSARRRLSRLNRLSNVQGTGFTTMMHEVRRNMSIRCRGNYVGLLKVSRRGRRQAHGKTLSDVGSGCRGGLSTAGLRERPGLSGCVGPASPAPQHAPGGSQVVRGMAQTGNVARAL